MPDVLLIGDTVRFPELRHETPVEIGDPFLLTCFPYDLEVPES